MTTMLATLILAASIGDLKLTSGQILKDVDVNYRTYGTINKDKSNVIVFPTWFNGTTANLEKFVGPGKLVDSSKYYVITIDALANGVSTSPSNSKTQKGSKFPKITIRDMVEAEHTLLTKVLGIDHAYAVMGVSMGGMQTFQWMEAYPAFMQRAVTIVGTPKMGTKEMLLWSTFLNQVPGLKGMVPGLGLLADLDPQTKEQLNDVVMGGAPPVEPAAPPSGNQLDLPSASETAQAPAAQGGGPGLGLPLNKNPMDVLKQFEAMLAHDIARPFKDNFDQAAAAIKARTLVVVATQDKAVSPALPLDFAKKLKAETFELTGPCGHKAYDCELDRLSPVIAKFLDAK